MRRELVLLVVAVLAGCGGDDVRTVYLPGECEPTTGTGGGQDATGGRAPSVISAGGAEAQGGAAGAGGEADGQGGSPGSTGRGGEGGSGGDGAPHGDGGGGGASDAEPEIIVHGVSDPGFLTCDGSHLYWVNIPTGDVYRSALDGSGATVLAAGAAPSVSDVEIDGSGLLYTYGGTSGRIIRVPLDGSPPGDAMLTPGIRWIAVHDGEVYWSDERNIYRGAEVVHNAQGSPTDIDVDASGIYYATDRAIMVAPFDGGAARKLADTESPAWRTLQVGQDSVSWGTSVALMRVTKGIGFPEVVAETPVTRLAVSPGLYAWSNKDAVYAMREGGEPRTLAPALGGGGVVLCGGFMFWLSSDARAILRAVP